MGKEKGTREYEKEGKERKAEFFLESFYCT
jgi:hypothetical protein